MTVVIWDGKSLCADKRATQSDHIRTVTKIQRIRGHLCAVAGDWDLAQEMFKWFGDGADPEKVPPFMRSKEEWVAFLVITPEGRVLKYERSPYPMEYTEAVKAEGFYAHGSGRDFAVGALAMGATARQAVEIASKHCVSCGNGIDELTLEEPQDE